MQTGIALYKDTCIKLCESKDEVANSSDSSEVTEFRGSKRERKLTEKGRDYLLELKTNIYINKPRVVLLINYCISKQK